MAQVRSINPSPAGDPQVAALKLPPHSIEAEQSLIGGLLLDNVAWDRIADIVAEGDFYRDDHRRIFAHIRKLVEMAKPADVDAILKALSATDVLIDDEVAASPMSVDRLEWEHIQRVLAENDGNISATARALKMHRRTLQRKLAKRPVKE